MPAERGLPFSEFCQPDPSPASTIPPASLTGRQGPASSAGGRFSPARQFPLELAGGFGYPTSIMSEVTVILDRLQQGESIAADELLPLVYEELRRVAAAKMALERNGHTLQPTALVHEAFICVGDFRHERRDDHAAYQPRV